METQRQWISGLAITLTTLVSLFGFCRLSPGATFVVASCALIALVFLFWFEGKEAEGKPNPPSVR